MTYYYFLVSHNFIDKHSSIIQLCNKYDGLHLIESYCEEYIKHLVGNNQEIKYYSEGDTNRVYGYFIEKSSNDLNKMTVRHKYIKNKGYFVNDVVVENIISYKLAICDGEYYGEPEEPFINMDFNQMQNFNKVIEQIQSDVLKIDNIQEPLSN